MAKLVYTAQARRDLVQIRRYIARRSGSQQVGVDFVGRLRAQCRKLAELPGTMGSARPEIREDVRSFPYGNYIILFRHRGDFFEVVSVIERHRDIAAIIDDDPQ